jgi:23S rRNA pseudouridine1911/1915/1917 synthase
MNAGYAYACTVGPEERRRGALDWLAAAFPHSSHATWAERLRRGEVRIDDRPIAEDTTLRPGQIVVWHRPGWEEPPVPWGFGVLHEDDDLLAVDKPAGLPTVPAGGFLTHTLLAQVRARWPHAVPMHRLGRGTSGVVLFALGMAARASVQAAWREGRVQKCYRTRVRGEPEREQFVIDVPIGPMPHARLGTVFAASRGGKPAQSRVTVRERQGDSTLVDVEIATGRPHQIRIHLAAAGHPLCGDPLYGAGGVVVSDALPGAGGYALHATTLVVPHPRDGRLLRVVSEAPPELRGDRGGGA